MQEYRNLTELFERCSATNQANGFEPTTGQNFIEKCALAMTELWEMVEAEQLDEDPQAEAVDFLIRCGSMLVEMGCDDGVMVPVAADEEAQVEMWEIVALDAFGEVCQAIEAYRRGTYPLKHIEQAMRIVAECCSPGLVQRIEAKNAYNAQRGYKHGKLC